jgi:type II secretory pathway component PulL
MKTEFQTRRAEISLQLSIEEHRLMDALRDTLHRLEVEHDAASLKAREAHRRESQAVMYKALAEFRDLEAAEKAAGAGI